MSTVTVTRCWRVANTRAACRELVAMLDAYGGVSIAYGERIGNTEELFIEEIEAPRASIAILMQAYGGVQVLATGMEVRA